MAAGDTLGPGPRLWPTPTSQGSHQTVRRVRDPSLGPSLYRSSVFLLLSLLLCSRYYVYVVTRYPTPH